MKDNQKKFFGGGLQIQINEHQKKVFDLASSKRKLMVTFKNHTETGFEKLKVGQKSDVFEILCGIRSEMRIVQKKIDALVFEENSIPINQMQRY